MKLLKLLIFLLVTPPLLSQNNNIIYDVNKNEFIDAIEKLKEGTTGKIIVKNFNPFMYNAKVEKNVFDNSSKVVPFLTSIPSRFFGISVGSLDDFKNKRKGYEAIENIAYDNFIKLYKKHIKIYLTIKQKTLDCNTLDRLLKEIDPTESLIDLFFNIQEKLTNINSKDIVNLDVLVKNVRAYLKANKNCETILGSYTVAGEKTSIQLNLTVREEAKGFETPLTDIIDEKVIITKGKKKIRFSSGIMLTKNVKPDYFTKITNDGTYQIIKEQSGNYSPGLSLLLHYEISDELYLNIGGGMSIETVPHFLIGGSYKILKTNLFLNAGYGWAYTNTLSDKFSLEETYITEPTIKTKKVLNKDFWFGISYQL